MLLNDAQKYYLILTIADAYAKSFCCENPDTGEIRILAQTDSRAPFRWQKKLLDSYIKDDEFIVFTISNYCFGEYESRNYEIGFHDIKRCLETCFFKELIDEVEEEFDKFYLTKTQNVL